MTLISIIGSPLTATKSAILPTSIEPKVFSIFNNLAVSIVAALIVLMFGIPY